MATFLALVCAVPAAAEGKSLLVSAASSLTDVLTSLKAEAEKAAGLPVEFNFGGSGALRLQIEQGAPVDLFLSASGADMDKLVAKGLVDGARRIDLLSNEVVLVGSTGEPRLSSAAEAAKRLSEAPLVAIGNPDSVPAGSYAMRAFAWLGVTENLEGHLVLGGSVRDVLAYVRTGSAPLGVVFMTDAMSPQAARGTTLVYRFPAASLDRPVVYPMAPVNGSASPKALASLIAFLRSEKAKAVFESAGFIVLH